MDTNSMLLKSHRHGPLGIADLCCGKHLTAALVRVQGEGLQRQAADAEVVSARGKAKPRCCG